MIPADTVILDTIHGSRLYGLAHADSDHDIFRVVYIRRKALVRCRDGLDYREFGFDKFLEYVYNGSHQSCEALFSPVAVLDDRFAPMLRGMRVGGTEAHSAYRRAIKAFAHGDLKKRRHAVRLGLNLASIRATGRFNPRLSEAEIHTVRCMADRYEGDELFDAAVALN